jgi:putative membrane protein
MLNTSRKFIDYLLISLKGIGMGAADVVPGVSGGTIAFISGIYEELLNSIKSVNFKAVKILFKGGIKEFWNAINGNFLTALLLGIAISILSLARAILYLLENFPIHVWAFFFGLILASALIIAADIKKWTPGVLIAIFVGTSIAYIVTVISPAETPTSSWSIFLTGMVAICAMILPGISGSFILLLMGKYEFILSALKDLNITVIAIFCAGCVAGLLGFSHLLSWMFTKYRDLTIGMLAGFMIGSLNKVWPWKETLQWRINSKGENVPFLQENILPGKYEQIYNEPSFLFGAILLFITGFIIIYLLEKIINKKLPFLLKQKKSFVA